MWSSSRARGRKDDPGRERSPRMTAGHAAWCQSRGLMSGAHLLAEYTRMVVLDTDSGRPCSSVHLTVQLSPCCKAAQEGDP